MQTQRSTERGNANLKFLIVMVIIGSCAYAGYASVTVDYQAQTFQDLMQQYVDVASAEGRPASWAGEQIIKNFGEYSVPSNALIAPNKRDNRIEVRIQYVKPVEFPG